MALDEKRGLVFVPTGSAAFDFYGANRHGDNLFANTLLCLDADTGKRVWHFQAVKHDVWDRDFPSAPALVTVKRDGRDDRRRRADHQVGPRLRLRARDRQVALPRSNTARCRPPASTERRLAETQPLPLAPPPFARQHLTEEMLTERTPEAHAAVLERFRKIRSNGQFEPPSLEGTIIFPGFDGGGEWGGAAFDPETGLLLRQLERDGVDSAAGREAAGEGVAERQELCTKPTAPVATATICAARRLNSPPSSASARSTTRPK